MRFFLPSPKNLAHRYIKQEALSRFEQDRIIYEGTPETIHFMAQSLPSTDPLLQTLAERWKIPLGLGQYFK